MKLVPAVVTTKLGRNALLLKKSSPTVLFGVGIVGVVGGTVLACRATLKMTTLLEESSKKLDKVREYQGSASMSYTENDREHDVALIRTQTTIGIIKLYLPPVIMTSVGITALTSSHRILANRNAALTAAYAALDEAYKRYRQRVVDKYGEEQDREFQYDTETVEIGSGKKIKTVTRVAGTKPSRSEEHT